MSFGRTNEKQQPTEAEMRDKIDLLQKKAFEKCRMFRRYRGNTNYDDFIWDHNECKEASIEVVAQIEELYKIKYGSK